MRHEQPENTRSRGGLVRSPTRTLTPEQRADELLAEADALRKVGDLFGVVGVVFPGAAFGNVAADALADDKLSGALDILRGIREGLERPATIRAQAQRVMGIFG